MLSVNQALSDIQENLTLLPSERRSLADARGQILAVPIYSPINMPPFRQSAMDGYALRLGEADKYNLIDEQKAGDSKHLEIKQHEAIRIFTGAWVPDDADTVVIQEHINKQGQHIELDKRPAFGANIRPVGEQYQKGELVSEKESLLNEAMIGLLAGLGVSEVEVYKKAKIGLLVTGNELRPAGTELKPGEIYESNAIMLTTALKRLGIEDVKIYKAEDELDLVNKEVKLALDEVDVLLVSGGISVGDYDFVKEAMLHNGVKEIFYKVNQKPGKPLWFGTKEHKSVFALPGNPASALTCFYVYVLPALRQMMGHKDTQLEHRTAVTTTDIANTTGKSLFLVAQVINDEMTVLKMQASSMLRSYAQANALALVAPDQTLIAKGEVVEYLNLNF